MRILSIFVPLFLLLAACGPTTFLVSREGYSTYFGRRNTGLSERLCTTGELQSILNSAAIPAIARDGFYRHACTAEYDWDKVVSIYQFMSPEEKKELMRAFARFGYEVNLVRC